jgi:hypothetical protein
VEEIDDGLALVHVAWQPDVVELCGFFCLEADNVYFADLPVFTVCYNPFSVSKPRVQLYFPHIRYVMLPDNTRRTILTKMLNKFLYVGLPEASSKNHRNHIKYRLYRLY